MWARFITHKHSMRAASNCDRFRNVFEVNEDATHWANSESLFAFLHRRHLRSCYRGTGQIRHNSDSTLVRPSTFKILFNNNFSSLIDKVFFVVRADFRTFVGLQSLHTNVPLFRGTLRTAAMENTEIVFVEETGGRIPLRTCSAHRSPHTQFMAIVSKLILLRYWFWEKKFYLLSLFSFCH